MSDRMRLSSATAADRQSDVASDHPSAKSALRREMRKRRRELPDQERRSARIWDQIVALDEVRAARRILAFSSIRGEPDTAALIAWAAAQDKEIAVPEDGVDPTWPQVVIVPGLAFTDDGARLGQGGGWYDRFLAAVRPECHLIGVAFAEQIVDQVPTEPHDIAVHRVVTDADRISAP